MKKTVCIYFNHDFSIYKLMYLIYDIILLFETIQVLKNRNIPILAKLCYQNQTHILHIHILEYMVKCIIAQLEIADKLC